MEQNTKSPTRSTADAHEGQIVAGIDPIEFCFRWPAFVCNRELDLARGDQVKVPLAISQPVGITCPVFLFCMVYKDLIEIGISDQDKDARLSHLMKAIDAAMANESPETTSVYVPYSVSRPPNGIVFRDTIELVAEIGSLDINDPQPAITVRYIYPDFDPFIYPDEDEERNKTF